ncbi:MAG TPA: ATP-binding protein, partial [Streptosporangiaceae bacterium]
TNTLRHTEATRAAVTLRYEPGAISVQIADGGPGQSAQSADARQPRQGLPAAGLGLAGIAERVASCGGSLTVGPIPAGGFTVVARLPSP